MIYIDTKNYRVYPDGQENYERITKTQAMILDELSITEIKTHEDIVKAIKEKFGRPYITVDSVRVHLSALRKKLGKEAFVSNTFIRFNKEIVKII